MSRPDRQPDRTQQLGRSHQRPGLLTAGQLTALLAIAGTAALLVLWHLTLVLTAGLGVGDIGVTLRGLLSAAPLDLPARYHPAGPGVTLVVFAVLCAAAIAGCVWWAVRTPTRGRRRDRRRGSAVGLADRNQARRSAGETRARDKARFTRRASITAGRLDPDTAPLAEVGLLLGHTTHDREPVVLTLEDQVGIIAATGAGTVSYTHLTLPTKA